MLRVGENERRNEKKNSKRVAKRRVSVTHQRTARKAKSKMPADRQLCHLLIESGPLFFCYRG